MRKLVIPMLALAFLTTCTDDGGPGGSGPVTTRVLLTDAPFPFDLMGSVDLHVVRVEAVTTTAPDAEWRTLGTPDRRVDLLSLQGGVTALLAEAFVRGTDLVAVRLTVRTDASAVTFGDGVAASVEWMGPARTFQALVEQPPEQDGDASTSEVIIDLDVARSFDVQPVVCDSVSGICPEMRPSFRFTPSMRVVNARATGTVAGVVGTTGSPTDGLVPVPHAWVSLYREDDPLTSVAGARADDDGRYWIPWVSAGPAYTVVARAPPDVGGAQGYARDLRVALGQETTADVVLETPPAPPPGAHVRIGGPTAMDVAEAVYLSAFVTGAEGDTVSDAVVAWRHSDPDVARLGGGGFGTVRLVGLAVGTTSLVAAAGNLADTVLVVVGDTTARVATVDVRPYQAQLVVGDSLAFQAVLRDSARRVLTRPVVTWTMGNPEALAVLGSAGPYLYVRAVTAGFTTVFALAEGVQGVASVTIEK